MSKGFRSSFLRTLDERGFLHQCTDLDALDDLFLQERVSAYIGFDCTAQSLHVGHLLSIMALRHLQRCGHTPIVLLGGGTTLVGDPSGKSEARKMLTPDVVANYLESIGASISHFLDFSTGYLCVNNADWLTRFNYVDFLRNYGVHFSVNRMLSFDSVKSRLHASSSLSFLEFNYMLLQAVDFVELHRTYGVRLQMGGADQWGNIINGTDLARRLQMPTLYGLTFPLLTTASGTKMGKTADGAVWLHADLCTPFDYWQYFRNTHDADVGRFLRLFTELPLDEIIRLEQLSGQEINEAKKILATMATSLCHGHTAALHAQKQAETLFEEKDMHAARPIVLDSSLFPLSILDLLMHAKLFSTRSAARRMLESGAVRLDGILCLDYRTTLQPFDSLIISIGKNTYYRCSLRA